MKILNWIENEIEGWAIVPEFRFRISVASDVLVNFSVRINDHKRPFGDNKLDKIIFLLSLVRGLYLNWKWVKNECKDFENFKLKTAHSTHIWPIGQVVAK